MSEITPEEIESAISFSRRAIELHESRSAPWAKAIVSLADERNALRAEVQRLRDELDSANADAYSAERVIANLRTAWQGALADVQRLREEVAQVRGTEERYRRVVALSDGARLDALWQELVAERDVLKTEARRSDAGRVEVPELTAEDMEQVTGREFFNGFRTGYNLAKSRARIVPSPQPSADVVVVPMAEYRALESVRHHATEVAAGIREMGPSRLSEPLEHALAHLDALRSSPNHDKKET